MEKKVYTHSDLFKVKWKAEHCHQGGECWCRIITPIEEMFDNNEFELYIIGSGEINKETAEYIVKLHNDNIDKIGHSKEEEIKEKIINNELSNNKRRRKIS